MNRITKVYTKTGDKGDTGVLTGLRVPKDCPQIHAVGDVDELNAVIGIVLAHDMPQGLREILVHLQTQLFRMGAELSHPKKPFFNRQIVEQLEEKIDFYHQHLPPLKSFILPSGGMAAASCHLARTVCRRAERSVVKFSRESEVNPQLRIYLNRLSDFLFVASRALAAHAGETETLWPGPHH